MKKLKENLLTVNMIPIDPPIAGPRALESIIKICCKLLFIDIDKRDLVILRKTLDQKSIFYSKSIKTF